MIEELKKGLLCTTSLRLIEPLEGMEVSFWNKENFERIAVFKPLDNEKERLWACFTDKVDLEIADYVVFTQVEQTIYVFIIELKKRKTSDNTKKATKQINSTLPLVKMMYEKITEEVLKNDQIIGVRVFGTGNKKVRKIPANDKLILDKNHRIPIFSFTQNKSNEQLTSFKHLLEKINTKG